MVGESKNGKGENTMKKQLIPIFLLIISLTFIVGAQEKPAEVTKKEALDAYQLAEIEMMEISELGSGVFYVQDRLIESQNALQVGGEANYQLILEKAQEISERKDRAYRISDTLRALKLRIDELGEKGLETTKAEENYNKALRSFENENYDEAEELIFQANKYLTNIEAEQTVLTARYNAARDNTITYLKEHWKAITIAVAILLVVGSLSYYKFELIKSRQRLEDMETEKKVLVEEMKKAQIEYFNKGLISKESYDIKMSKYREMMINIKENLLLVKSRLKKTSKIEKILRLKERLKKE